jgi:hypothetical protein
MPPLARQALFIPNGRGSAGNSPEDSVFCSVIGLLPSVFSPAHFTRLEPGKYTVCICFPFLFGKFPIKRNFSQIPQDGAGHQSSAERFFKFLESIGPEFLNIP